MATCTELADFVCRSTGLLETGDERTRVINLLNDAYKNGCRLSGCNEVSTVHTFVASQDDYTISSDLSLTDVQRIISLQYSDGSWPFPLTRVAEDEILALRTGSVAGGYTRVYSVMGLDTLMLYPKPAINDTLTLRYLQRPDTLVESGPSAGEETSPSSIPAEFHYSVIASGAIVNAALSLDQRIDDLEKWERRYTTGLADLKAHVETFTATPALIFNQSRGISADLRDPDQRGRG